MTNSFCIKCLKTVGGSMVTQFPSAPDQLLCISSSLFLTVMPRRHPSQWDLARSAGSQRLSAPVHGRMGQAPCQTDRAPLPAGRCASNSRDRCDRPGSHPAPVLTNNFLIFPKLHDARAQPPSEPEQLSVHIGTHLIPFHINHLPHWLPRALPTCHHIVLFDASVLLCYGCCEYLPD